MTEAVQLFLALGVMIGFAKGLGYLSYRLNQPTVLGELLAGLLIGPTVFNLLGNTTLFPDGDSVKHMIIGIGEVGVLMLMFMAGLEVDLKSMLRVGRPTVLAGVIGVIVPLLMITPAVILFNYHPAKALFIGILFASMSTSISAQVMLEMGVLHRREGLTMLGAALVDDAVVILLLSLFLAINPGGVVTVEETRSVVEVVVRMGGFLVLGFIVSWFVLPRLANWISRLQISQGAVMFAIVATLLLSFAAEFVGGIAAITGAFMVGVGVRRARRSVAETIEHGIHVVNYSILVPLFFISIGLQANLQLLTADVLPFALVMAALAIVSKMIGAGGGARLGGFNWPESLRVALGMISRGEIGLIIAAIGINMGILQPETFAAVVFVVLVTTLITPPLIRWSFAREQAPQDVGQTAATST
ncbi:MAG: cation:proton antiporter [Anaerolineae bacterium]|nr:cation:proton antiporter [Anaerolineae bacterium]